MLTHGANLLEMPVCNPDTSGRILKSDQSGRTYHAGCRQNIIPFRRMQGARQVNVLSELKVGDSGILVSLDLPESVQNHLMHMGFVPDARITALRCAPAGDPTVYSIDGMEIALRHETAEAIRVRPAAKELDHTPGLRATAQAVGIPQLREATR